MPDSDFSARRPTLVERIGFRRQAKDSQRQLVALAKRGANIDSVAIPPHDPRNLGQRMADGWTNILAGIGLRGDKRERTYFENWRLIQDPELQTAYLGDGVCTNIVDFPADDQTREWIDLEAKLDTEEDEEEALDQVKADLDDLDAEVGFNLALKWARLYGGALIVMGIMDGQEPDQPLNIKNIRGISGLRIVDRVDVHIWNSIFDTDIMSPTFGQPLVFDCIFHVGTTRVEQYVHATRCIPVYGRRVPQNVAYLMNMEHRYWGVSEIQFCYEQLRDFGGIRASVSNILYEFIIGKYTIEGLQDMIASGNEAAVKSRINIINASKSVLNAVLLGTNEKYERDTASLAGIPEVIDRFMMMLSGVCRIPVSRLFGRSAAGMNATGEGDMNNYYDLIRSLQKTQLKPALRKLVDTLRAWRKITVDIEIKFNSLEQMSDKEKAEIEVLKQQAFAAKAQAYSAYIQAGVLDPMWVFDEEFKDQVEARMGEIMAAGKTPGVGPEPDQGVEASLENEPTEPLQPPVVVKTPPQQIQQRQPMPPSSVPLELHEFQHPVGEEGGGPS